MQAWERTSLDGASVLEAMIFERAEAQFDDRTIVAAILVRKHAVCFDAMIIKTRNLAKIAIAAAQTLQYSALDWRRLFKMLT